MKLALAALVGLSLGTLGCASMGQETTMFRGPFGRTQIASTVLAADQRAGKILVQTPEGTLRVFRVDATAGRLLAGFRVGDQLLLTFDDRTSGDNVVAVERLAAPTRNGAPGGMAGLALPSQVQVGAPLIGSSRTYGRVAGVTGNAIDLSAATMTADADGGAAGGVVGGGVVGTTGVTNGLAGGTGTRAGVAVPGFAGIGNLQTGALTSEQVASLGLGSSNGLVLSPTNVPATGPTTSGNFTPGTTSPGVTTLNGAAPGRPTITGPFTPGTVAPGVSATRGNAAPSGASTVQGSTGSSQGRTIRTPGAQPPVPDSVSAGATAGAVPGGISGAGVTGTGAPAPAAQGGGTAGTAAAPTAPPARDQGATRTDGARGTGTRTTSPGGGGTSGGAAGTQGGGAVAPATGAPAGAATGGPVGGR